MSGTSPAPRTVPVLKRAALTFGCFWLCAATPFAKNAQQGPPAVTEEESATEEDGQSVPFGASTQFGFRTRVRALTPRELREYQDLQLQFSKTTADAQKAIQKRLDEIAESVAVLAKPKGKGGEQKEGGGASDSPLASLRGDVAALKASSEKQTVALGEIVLLLKQQAAFNRLLFGYASEAPNGGAAAGAASETRGAGAVQNAAERAQERLQEKAAEAVSVRKIKTPPPAEPAPPPAAPVQYEEPETLKAPEGGGAWIIR